MQAKAQTKLSYDPKGLRFEMEARWVKSSGSCPSTDAGPTAQFTNSIGRVGWSATVKP